MIQNVQATVIASIAHVCANLGGKEHSVTYQSVQMIALETESAIVRFVSVSATQDGLVMIAALQIVRGNLIVMVVGNALSMDRLPFVATAARAGWVRAVMNRVFMGSKNLWIVVYACVNLAGQERVAMWYAWVVASAKMVTATVIT